MSKGIILCIRVCIGLSHNMAISQENLQFDAQSFHYKLGLCFINPMKKSISRTFRNISLVKTSF